MTRRGERGPFRARKESFVAVAEPWQSSCKVLPQRFIVIHREVLGREHNSNNSLGFMVDISNKLVVIDQETDFTGSNW